MSDRSQKRRERKTDCADRNSPRSTRCVKSESLNPPAPKKQKQNSLPNGVRAVAVQDEAISFAAACANVAAGYFDDPPSAMGLAHFLEHAVHLGSEAFPGDGEYKHFLAQHGGSSNASTSESGV